MEGEGSIDSSQLQPIVCIVGLAYLDGVRDICPKQAKIELIGLALRQLDRLGLIYFH